jgi:hypothetical protein
MDVFDKLRNLSICDKGNEEEDNDTSTTKDFEILSSDNPIFNRKHISSKVNNIILLVIQSNMFVCFLLLVKLLVVSSFLIL